MRESSYFDTRNAAYENTKDENCFGLLPFLDFFSSAEVEDCLFHSQVSEMLFCYNNESSI